MPDWKSGLLPRSFQPHKPLLKGTTGYGASLEIGGGGMPAGATAPADRLALRGGEGRGPLPAVRAASRVVLKRYRRDSRDRLDHAVPRARG